MEKNSALQMTLLEDGLVYYDQVCDPLLTVCSSNHLNNWYSLTREPWVTAMLPSRYHPLAQAPRQVYRNVLFFRSDDCQCVPTASAASSVMEMKTAMTHYQEA